MAGKNLGTAWIQIKPTTRGITSEVKKELASTEKEMTGTQSTFSKGWARTMGVASSLTSKAFDLVTRTVKNSLDSAITRSDTINNFATVMKNSLGVGADEAKKSISQLADGLDGLPTKLDDLVPGVQRFTAVNKDLNKSTKAVLALNDAILAGGASEQVQAAAMEQLTQAYSKGKPDAMEWRSMLQAMPLQMQQVAEAMGYTSSSIGGDLHTALKKGEITMDDFIDKIIELDEKGPEGLASFKDAAIAATGGLATQLSNISTSVSKVLVDIMNGDDVALQNHLQQLVERITKAVPTLIKVVVEGIVQIISMIPQMLPDLLKAVMDTLPSIIQGLVQLIIGIVQALPDLIVILLDGLTAAVPQLVGGIKSILTAIIEFVKNPDNLNQMLGAFLELLFTLLDAIPDLLVALIEALPQILNAIINWLLDPETLVKLINAAVNLFFGIVQAVPKILGALITAFKDLAVGAWDRIKNFFGNFANDFGKFITDIFKNAINGMLGFIEGFLNTPINLINGFLDVINNAFGWLGVNIGKIPLVQLPRLATGGIVQGVGTDTSDSNLYALSRGEYVIKAASARKIGYSTLDRINQTGNVSEGAQTIQNFTINGYNKDPEELANIISRKIAFNQRGVLG